MLFHESLFSEVMSDDQAVIVAKLCNQLINQNAKVMYGSLLSDGSCEDFSTAKKRTDTHVCLGVDISLMGSLKPRDVAVALDEPTREDKLRLLMDRNAQLERELNLERGRK